MDPVYYELRDCAAVLYDSRSTNQQRHDAYCRVEQGIAQHGDPDGIVTAAMTMLQETTLPPEHLGFAASVISDLLRQGRVSCASVPYTGMATYLSAGRVHAVVVSGISNVLSQCALQLWPNDWIDMLDCLCPEDLVLHPELCIALEACVSTLVDAEPSSLPKGQFSVIRKALDAAAPVLVARVVSAIGALITDRPPFYNERTYVGPPLQATLSQLLLVAERMIPYLPTQLWWDCYLHELVCNLLAQDSADLVLHAANIFSAMIAASSSQAQQRGSVWSGNEIGHQLLVNVLGYLEMVAKAESWESVDVLLSSIQALSSEDIQSVAQPVFVMIDSVIIGIPSVKFALASGELLLEVLPTAIDSGASVDNILRCLKLRCRKFVSHPVTGWDSSSQFSADQYATTEDYESSFSLFRGVCGKVFLLIAKHAPEASMTFVAEAIQNLPSPQPSDPRNRFGHIDQKSPTYVEWEATFFVTENSEAAVSDARALEAVKSCFAVCSEIFNSVTDATLVPVLLNTLASLWASPYTEHWGTSMNMLFYFITLEPHNGSSISSDPDVVSARRRAASLLIRACTEYGAVVSSFAGQIVQSVQEVLINTTKPLLPSEVPMLYEAVAALSNVMTSDEQQTFLGGLIKNHVDTFSRIADPITPKGLALMLTSPSREAKDDRFDFRTAVGIISAVLKRCNPQSPIAYDLAFNLQASFTRVLICFFQLQPHLPPQHQKIFDLDPAERQALATTGNQRPPTNTHDPITSCAVGIRTNLYSGIAAMLTVLNSIPPIFSDLCGLLTPNASEPLMATHLAKQMCTQCLFEAVTVYPPCVLHVLPAVGMYIEAHAQVQRHVRDEVIESKLITTIYRVGAAVVKRAIVEAPPEKTLMGDEQIATCVVQFYLSVARSGYELKTVLFDLLPFCSRPEDPFATEVVATLIAATPLPRVDVAQRRFVLDKMSDLYMKHFPRFVGVFETLGASAEEIEQLHSTLMTAARPDLKRKRFADFIANKYGVAVA